MYEGYWGLRERPFHTTPDPRFLYRSSQHEEGLLRLLYAIQQRLGAGMLTGVYGCGKTTLARALIKELSNERFKIAFITNPKLTYVELMMLILQELGVNDLPTMRSEVLANRLFVRLKELLSHNMQEGKETVVIVDEAHVIEEREVFEGLRLLLNFQTDERYLLTLLLLGQPELKRKVDDLRPFEQRIAIKWHLGSLSDQETFAYLRHRLEIAGSTRELFTEEAVSAIHQASGGIPRRINRLCDLCLLAGMGQGASIVDRTIVEEEIAGLGEGRTA